MKRKLLLSLSAALLSSSLFAGGIMTNTNQSASYARMLARNASLSIDGVYYNPAGLTKLGNGFHLSLNNQTIFQNQLLGYKKKAPRVTKRCTSVSLSLSSDRAT